jgi:hypothetical protein
VLLQGCGSPPAYPPRFELIAHRGAHPYYYGEATIYSPEQRSRLVYWGGESEYRTLHHRLPELHKLATGREMSQCADAASRRLMIGRLPAVCRNQGLILPAARLRAWYVRAGMGWPNRFLKKVNRANSFLYMATDSAGEALNLTQLPVAGILTDKIGVIGRSAP